MKPLPSNQFTMNYDEESNANIEMDDLNLRKRHLILKFQKHSHDAKMSIAAMESALSELMQGGV